MQEVLQDVKKHFVEIKVLFNKRIYKPKLLWT